MSRATPKGSYAVMASRVEAVDALDFFPTPPFATRALCEHVLPELDPAASLKSQRCLEPAAGEGHMSEVIKEYFAEVVASDVHDYGRGYRVASYTGHGADVLFFNPIVYDWIITNPPFNAAVEFAERALKESTVGFALLLRSVWAESADRYERLFRDTPPQMVAQFVERVPMVKGRWDPKATTATGYAWFVWHHANSGKPTRFFWIPPGCRKRLTKPDDAARFAA